MLTAFVIHVSDAPSRVVRRDVGWGWGEGAVSDGPCGGSWRRLTAGTLGTGPSGFTCLSLPLTCAQRHGPSAPKSRVSLPPQVNSQTLGATVPVTGLPPPPPPFFGGWESCACAKNLSQPKGSLPPKFKQNISRVPVVPTKWVKPDPPHTPPKKS